MEQECVEVCKHTKIFKEWFYLAFMISQILMSVLVVLIVAALWPGVLTLRVATSVTARKDTKEMEGCAQVWQLLLWKDY